MCRRFGITPNYLSRVQICYTLYHSRFPTETSTDITQISIIHNTAVELFVKGADLLYSL
jgi:hypothetical protein